MTVGELPRHHKGMPLTFPCVRDCAPFQGKPNSLRGFSRLGALTMRLLIAGWRGQVARALMRAAPSAPDVKAVSVGRPALDLVDPNSIERLFNDALPTVVINSAAYTAVDQAEAEPEKAFSLNADGARLVARAAARRQIPLIHLSTHYVFDGSKDAPYTEDDVPCPATVFGRSKLDGERAVATEAPRHIILRTGWVYSALAGNFATRVLDTPPEASPLRIVSDQRGNPTYAPHLAKVILEIARQITRENGAAPWGLYHAAGAGLAGWDELARALLARAAGAGRPTVDVEGIASADYPTPAPRPMNSALSTARLETTFGLTLPTWQDGVRDCVAELLDEMGRSRT